MTRQQPAGRDSEATPLYDNSEQPLTFPPTKTMRTFLARTVTAVTACGVGAFTAHSRLPRSALQPTPHHSSSVFFSTRPLPGSTFSSAAATSSGPFSWARQQHSCSRTKRRPRVGGSRGQRSASTTSLNMFDGTDLFQLQQWAGDVSATEVSWLRQQRHSERYYDSFLT